VDVIQTLGDRQALAIVAAIEVPGPTGRPVRRPGGVDIVDLAGGEEHLADALGECRHERRPDARAMATRRRIAAVEDRALTHLDADREQLAVAPGHVPEDR